MKTSKNIIKKIMYTGVILMGLNSFAQEAPVTEEVKDTKPTFSGGVDMYTKYDFANNGNANNYTSFTGSQGSFEIGMATIKAEHQIGKVGAVVDLGFGKRAEEFAYAETFGTAFSIKQAYLTYEIINKLTITGGTFGTHIGYELLDAADNRNYSMSYAFSYGPFLNTGLKASYQITDEFSAMFGVTLPTDYRSAAAAATSQKALIGQLAYTTDEASLYLSGTSGSSDPAPINTSQFDFVGDFSIADEFGVGVNLTYQNQKSDLGGSSSWYSGVLYAKYDPTEKVNLTWRSEFYDDKDGISAFSGVTGKSGLPGSNVFANTLSLNYKIDNLTIIPEFRMDLASEDAFLDHNSLPTNTSMFFLLAAAYTF